jgi:sugar phosphate isomerase/epimerase
MRVKAHYPFRLGTTSYIWPDDILPNVRQLAPLVDDVELVLFESDEYGSNLPGEDVIAELRQLAQSHDLTYTVHLPLDLRLGDGDDLRHPSLEKARRVIERTQPLNPFAYVVHLDGKVIESDTSARALDRWQSQAARSLVQVADWAGDAGRVCVENLENYDPAAFAPVLDIVPVSRCVDVGHLWRLGLDPLPYLQQWHAEGHTHVVHLHGVNRRDHKSLAEMSPDALDPVVQHLLENMRGVVTLEVFGVDDLFSSRAALGASVQRLAFDKSEKDSQ